MTDEITQPVDGDVEDVEWVSPGELVAKVRKDGTLYAESYEFVGGEKILGDST